MKILLVHNYYQQPGGEDVVFTQERRLLEQKGHQVITYTRTNQEAAHTSLAGRVKLLKTIVSAEDSRQQIASILDAEKPDLAHIHNTFMMISPSVYTACWQAQIPTVQTLHNYRLYCPAVTFYRDGHVCEDCISGGLMQGVRYGCYRDSKLTTAAVAMMLKVHRSRGTWTQRVNAFIALTEFSKRKFVDNGLPADKVHVKPNFVDLNPEREGAAGKYAFFAGRLTPEKGIATLLDAWRLLEKPLPLKIVGEGTSRSALESQAQRDGLRDVEFLGWRDGEQTRDLMKRAYFVVVPSLWYEGFPMVLAESFACGVPVIASRLGAMEEIVDHSHTGLHFKPGSPEDLAQAVRWALEHPESIAEMGRNARRQYELRYTPEVNYALLMEIYGKAMSRSWYQEEVALQV
jgi:glycosyltransferase involved in cell wall biosynthesis